MISLSSQKACLGMRKKGTMDFCNPSYFLVLVAESTWIYPLSQQIMQFGPKSNRMLRLAMCLACWKVVVVATTLFPLQDKTTELYQRVALRSDLTVSCARGKQYWNSLDLHDVYRSPKSLAFSTWCPTYKE